MVFAQRMGRWLQQCWVFNHLRSTSWGVDTSSYAMLFITRVSVHQSHHLPSQLVLQTYIRWLWWPNTNGGKLFTEWEFLKNIYIFEALTRCLRIELLKHTKNSHHCSWIWKVEKWILVSNINTGKRKTDKKIGCKLLDPTQESQQEAAFKVSEAIAVQNSDKMSSPDKKLY